VASLPVEVVVCRCWGSTQGGRSPTGAPSWPKRTDGITQIFLSSIIKRKSSAGQKLGYRRVRLDILDYPGECLFELPLLDQTFAAWSAATFGLSRQSPRRKASDGFLEFPKTLRPADPSNEVYVRQGHDLYRAALETCRNKYGLRYLQLGRFLCPGPRADVPFMPVEQPSTIPHGQSGILQAHFRGRTAGGSSVSSSSQPRLTMCPPSSVTTFTNFSCRSPIRLARIRACRALRSRTK
jgi:hypothetical protein